MLAMAAKAFNHVLYIKLYEHAQDLFSNVFRRGSKSVEIVQAILILTYWKEPQDTRVWTSVGYAIRICMDLGWHKLAYSRPVAVTTESEDQRRERRNIERTWYVLFVYDRRYDPPVLRRRVRGSLAVQFLTLIKYQPADRTAMDDRMQRVYRVDRRLVQRPFNN
jgi:hypothetical protein